VAQKNAMTESSFKRMWEVVTKRVDFHVTSHMLKHTYCTNWHKAGIDMRTAQYVFGDDDLRTVSQIYTHIENDEVENATQKIAAMYQSSESDKSGD
jgi:site-specific recombinase XerD